MKSVVKIIKSFHADSNTLSAMFLGYFVLFAVTATLIVNSADAGDSSSVATSKVKTEHASSN